MRLPGKLTLVLALLSLSLAVGCSGTPPTRSYVLDSVAVEPLEEGAPAEPISVSVGPVSIPGYLDRPEMVTRQSDTQLQIAQSDRWAESLDSGVARVLAQNLNPLLGDGKVSVFRWSGGQLADYRVAVDVLRMDGRLGADLVLEAQWRINSDRQDLAPVSNAAGITVPVEGERYEAFAAAASQALGKLSRLIAADLQQVVKE